MNGQLSFIATVGALAIFAIGASPARANLIIDGGFETPVIAAGTYTAFSVGQTLGDWTVIGTAAQQAPAVAIVSSTFTEPPDPPYINTSQEGNQWIDLTGVAVNGPNGVQQTVATTVGVKYELSFWIGNVSGLDRGPVTNIEAFVDGVSLGIFTNSTPGTILAWSEFTEEFTASGSSTVIAFINRDPLDDHVSGLDNVTLNIVAVPEPATYVLMLSGLSLIGFTTRRRNPSRPISN